MARGWEPLSPIEAPGTLFVAAPGSGSILNPPGVLVSLGGSVVVIRITVRPNSTSPEFRASVVLNYSCYGVMVSRIGCRIPLLSQAV